MRESDVQGEDERTGRSRRSSDALLKFLAILLTVVITIGTTLIGYIASQLQDLRIVGQATRDTVLTTSARQDERMNSLDVRLTKLELAVSAQERTSNLDFSTRLARVEAKVGINARREKEE